MAIDPDPETMRRLGYRAVDRAVEHLARLGSLRVMTPPDPQQLHELVRESLPRQARGVEESIDKLFDELLPRATLVNHPRFFAYVPGPGSFVGALGEWLAAATNCFVGTWLGGSVMAALEARVVDWLREAIGLPEAFGCGVLTSGGSLANLSALAAARARAARDGHDVNALRVLVGAEAHYSMVKAARVLGVAGDAIVTVPVDGEQRMRVDALQQALDAHGGGAGAFVCATAGTTSTGAVDPIADIAALCRERGAWLHVDGAYGAALAALPEQRELRLQLAHADSLTLDPHKWLYSPFECGCLLLRDASALHAAFAGDAHYMEEIPKHEVNFYLRGPELSRGNRALKLWLLLRGVGLDAIADAIREDLRRCRLAHDLLARDPRVRIVTPPRMSMFSFAVEGGEAAARRLIQRLMDDGFAMLTSSRVDGQFVVRFCVVNHRTTDDDVRQTCARILAALQETTSSST